MAIGISGTADEWNAQRTAVIDRLLRGILYPKFGRELLDALKREAHDVLRAECASRLRKMALAPPCRAPKVPILYPIYYYY